MHYTVLLVILILNTSIHLQSQNEVNSHDSLEHQRDHIIERMKYESSKVVNPFTQKIPMYQMIPATNFKDEMVYNKRTYIVRFPDIINSQWTSRGPTNSDGRALTVMYDPTDPSFKRVYTGGVGGGIWRNNNINHPDSPWTSMSERLPIISISCMAYDPTNRKVMYAGTGEGCGADYSMPGYGVCKSIDSGKTWSILTSTLYTDNFNFCFDIFVDYKGHLYVGTKQSGLMKSTNGGISFSSILGNGVGGCSSSVASGIKMGADSTMYITFGNVNSKLSVWKKAKDSNSLWKEITPPSLKGQIQYSVLAIAPTNANKLYIVDQVGDILRSDNKGETWIALTKPKLKKDSTASWTQGQGFYDLDMKVSPVNANHVYVAAVNAWRSLDSGVSWSQITKLNEQYSLTNNAHNNYIHSDIHKIEFQPGNPNTALWATDGGIYISNNMLADSVTWKAVNKGLVTTQYYATDISPVNGSKVMIAGAQDNGTHHFDSRLRDYKLSIGNGDGAFCHIDKDTAAFQIGSTQFSWYMYSLDTGNSFLPGKIPLPSGVNWNLGLFINPTDWDSRNNRLYANVGYGYICLQYNAPTSTNINGTWTPMINTNGFNGNSEAVRVDPNNSRILWLAEGNLVYKVIDPNPSSNNCHLAAIYTVTGSPRNANPSCLQVEEGNSNHLLISYSNFGVPSIFESINGGQSWRSIEGNLADMPVRWIEFNPYNHQQAFIATELGVMETNLLNCDSTFWKPSGSNFPNTRVSMIKLRASDSTIIASSYGRGLWSNTIRKPAVGDTNYPVCCLKALTVNSTSALVSWESPVAYPSRYKLEYKKNSNTSWSLYSDTITQNSIRLVNLLSNEIYNWRVSRKSGAIYTTATPGPRFKVENCNIAPTNLSFICEAPDYKLSWTSIDDAVSYTVKYQYGGQQNWDSISAIKTTKVSLPNLQMYTNYTCKVSANYLSCKSPETIGYFSTIQFTPPYNAVADSITDKSVYLNWSYDMGDMIFELLYRRVADTNFPMSRVAGSGKIVYPNVANYNVLASYRYSVKLSNLMPGTEYEWSVRAKGNAGYYSRSMKGYFKTK
jgi:hypothetical protein